MALSNKPAVIERQQGNNVQNPQPLPPSPAQDFIKITSPDNGVKIDHYKDFTVRWETSSGLRNETLDVYVSGVNGKGGSTQFTCLPGQDPNRSASYECKEALVARIPASTGSYLFKINPGCAPEMPIQVRVATKDGNHSASVGPIILRGGACGPG